MDSEKQTEGFGREGGGGLGELGGGYYGGHVFHGALGVVYKQWSIMPPSERMDTQLLYRHGQDWKRLC